MCNSGGYFFCEAKEIGMDLTFNKEAYEAYLNRKEYIPSNTRIRPDDMNIFEWLSSVNADMDKTPEGRQIIAALQSIDD
jgi:hypothetical protein